MKYFLPILLIFSFVLCEQYEDVVYLKNGTVIRGMIIEQAPNKYVKIKSGENIFVFEINKIQKITKELNKGVDSQSHIILDDKTFSISLGFLDDACNIISLRKDIPFNEKNTVFGSFAIGLGLNYVNIGIKTDRNYNESGWTNLVSTGFWIDAWGDTQLTLQGSSSYRFRLGESSTFFNLGLTSGFSMDTWDSSVYYTIFPVISFSTQF